MQTLKLADDLFEPLERGEKHVTIRKGRRDIQLGDLQFQGIGDESLKKIVEVTEIRYLRVSGIPDYMCVEDGFNDWIDFFNGMKRFYPELKATNEVTIIYFE